jgi:hypothetical protein
MSSPTNRKKIFEPLVAKYKDAEIMFLHPSFVERARKLWGTVKRELEAGLEAPYRRLRICRCSPRLPCVICRPVSWQT